MIVDPKTLKSIANSEDQTCFGCGAKNHSGLKMEFFTDDRRLYSFMKVPISMAGWHETVHGGILSTILDEIMGWAVIYLFKKLGVTKSITVNFIKPVRAEKQLTVVGTFQQKPTGRSVIMTGEIYNADDVLCADGTGEFSMLDPKLAIRLGLVSSEYMTIFDPLWPVS